MILFGKLVAEKIYQNLKIDLNKLKQKEVIPKMAVILVGENLPSLAYVKIKEKIAERLGIGFDFFHLPAMVTEKSICDLIKDLNKNKYIFGIVVQLPLPENFNTEKILRLISPNKDIDGFYGKMLAPTAQAILEILKFYKINLKEKNIVILGYGRLVGQPLEKLLVKMGIKPIVCDSKTQDLTDKLKLADVIVTATGIYGLIKKRMVKKEVIIIDAGTSESNGKLVGDLDSKIYPLIQSYSPVPGGVGPVTVACLMKNVVETTKKQSEILSYKK